MGEKISYLKKYKGNVQLLSCHEMTKVDARKVPNMWYELFQEENVHKRVESTLSIWKEQVGEELRNTISYLEEHLEEVDLLDIDGIYSILYTIKTDNGEIRYYQGGNPKDDFNHEELERNWVEIPETIRKFYQTVHNGFYFYASHSMGLVPLEDVTFFNEDEWSIIEELEEPLQLNLQTTFGFFKSGMGGYVAVDYENNKSDHAILWWTYKQPIYNVNFWDIVDEWTVIGFED
ncbi:hypothetical protein A374_18980 [Fictibacillus macauensis ZFHKF-1]|uniref:SMI1/KNR4 family protein n=1 Tax=Fictibacillus macauensis ZFHKF-1 TaxID=1196324 RepID=I8AEH4_9BACL|nr:SMI1/KNR4 family protein [Fictibacillus macauensis]EIT83734.1 hypothetical protein A374_18980 [Fictibacillus macauensis ZFHKF-1]